MTDAHGSFYHAMPGGLPARLRIEGIGAAAEQSRFLARMARPAVTDMTSCALAPPRPDHPSWGPASADPVRVAAVAPVVQPCPSVAVGVAR